MRKKPHHYIIPSKHNKQVPHLLSEVSVVGVVLIFVGIFMFSTLGKIVIQKTSLLSLVQSFVLIDLANESREDVGLHTLKLNTSLVKSAQLKADDMATKGYFAHTSPDGATPWQWFDEAQYGYRYAGENLAINFTDSIEVNEAWLNSPTHRENLLQEKFTEIGIATSQGMYKGKEATFVVQHFGTPRKVASLPPVVTEPEVVTLVSNIIEPETEVIEVVEVIENNVEKLAVAEPETDTDTMLGESSAETETFIAVKSQEDGEIEILTLDETPQYSTVLGKMIVNPSRTTQAIYLILGALITLSLILMSFVELKHHHKKHFFYGIIMLILLLFFIVMNKEVLSNVFTII